MLGMELEVSGEESSKQGRSRLVRVAVIALVERRIDAAAERSSESKRQKRATVNGSVRGIEALTWLYEGVGMMFEIMQVFENFR